MENEETEATTEKAKPLQNQTRMGAMLPAPMRLKKQGGFFYERVVILLITLVLGCFSLLVTSEFRNVVSSALQCIVPISARKLTRPGYLFLYYIFNFLMMLGIFVILCVILIPIST